MEHIVANIHKPYLTLRSATAAVDDTNTEYQLPPLSIVRTDANSVLITGPVELDSADTAGVLPIDKGGSGSGVTPTITGSADIVISGAWPTWSINTSQPLASSASPTFSDLTLSAPITGFPLMCGVSGLVTNTLINLSTMVSSVLPVSYGGTGVTSAFTLTGGNSINVTGTYPNYTVNTVQDLRTTATPGFAGLTVGLLGLMLPNLSPSTPLRLDGSEKVITGAINLASSSDVTGVLAAANMTATTLTGDSTLIVGGSFPNFTISAQQQLTTTSSPTFANLTDSGLSISSLVVTDTAHKLISASISNSNGCNFSLSGSTLTATMTQNLTTSGTPTFGNLTINGWIDLPTNPTPPAGGTYLYNQSGIGFTVQSPQFEVVANGVLGFRINSSQQVTTKNNTVDDGSGGMLITAADVLNPSCFRITRAGTANHLRTRITLDPNNSSTSAWEMGTDPLENGTNTFYLYNGTLSGYVLQATTAGALTLPQLGTGILHAGSSGAITSSAVSLTADVSGILPIANGGTGTSSPALIAGTNITLSGSAWPNQTINTVNSPTFTNITGTLLTAAQPNVTSVGTLTGLTVVSNVISDFTLALRRSSYSTSYSTTISFADNSPAIGGTTTKYWQMGNAVGGGIAQDWYLVQEGAQGVGSCLAFSASGAMSLPQLSTGILHSSSIGAITSSLVSLTADVSGILPILNGGSGSSSPALIAGSGIAITGSWPNQTITANGANLISGTNISISGNTINVINSPILSGTLTVNTITSAASTDIKIGAPSGFATRLAHDVANGFCIVGSGNTTTSFTVVDSVNTYLQVAAGSLTSRFSTLDDGSGNMTVGGALTISKTSNQLILGITHTTTITSPAPSASRTYTIPDAGVNANIVLDQGNYTIAGNWSFPYPSSSITTGGYTMIGSSSDCATSNAFGLCIAAPASAGNWPFGICVGGGGSSSMAFRVGTTKQVLTLNNTLDDGFGGIVSITNASTHTSGLTLTYAAGSANTMLLCNLSGTAGVSRDFYPCWIGTGLNYTKSSSNSEPTNPWTLYSDGAGYGCSGMVSSWGGLQFFHQPKVGSASNGSYTNAQMLAVQTAVIANTSTATTNCVGTASFGNGYFNGTLTVTSTITTGRGVVNATWTGSGQNVTCNTNSGSISFASFSVANNASVQFVVNNSLVTTSSVILVTPFFSTLVGNMFVWMTQQGSGSFTVTVANTGGSTFSHPMGINFLAV